MPVDEGPRERMIRGGAAGLSDAELLAPLIQPGGRGKSSLDLARQVVAGGLLALAPQEWIPRAASGGLGLPRVASIGAALELAAASRGLRDVVRAGACHLCCRPAPHRRLCASRAGDLRRHTWTRATESSGTLDFRRHLTSATVSPRPSPLRPAGSRRCPPSSFTTTLRRLLTATAGHRLHPQTRGGGAGFRRGRSNHLIVATERPFMQRVGFERRLGLRTPLRRAARCAGTRHLSRPRSAAHRAAGEERCWYQEREDGQVYICMTVDRAVRATRGICVNPLRRKIGLSFSCITARVGRC